MTTLDEMQCFYIVIIMMKPIKRKGHLAYSALFPDVHL